MWATITGSARGLGRGLALGFAERGYSLVLHARNNALLEETAQLAQKFKVQTKLIVGDLTDSKVLQNITDTSSAVGSSILLNNAAIPCPGKPFTELSSKEIADLLKVNLEIPISLTHSFWPRLKGTMSPAIIFLNSMVGIEPKLHRTIYTAVRFGLRGFTESLALEAKDSGIRVFGVYPTRIRSRPEYEYGFEVDEVVQMILEFYDHGTGTELILDGRPK